MLDSVQPDRLVLSDSATRLPRHDLALDSSETDAHRALGPRVSTLVYRKARHKNVLCCAFVESILDSLPRDVAGWIDMDEIEVLDPWQGPVANSGTEGLLAQPDSLVYLAVTSQAICMR